MFPDEPAWTPIQILNFESLKNALFNNFVDKKEQKSFVCKKKYVLLHYGNDMRQGIYYACKYHGHSILNEIN